MTVNKRVTKGGSVQDAMRADTWNRFLNAANVAEQIDAGSLTTRQAGETPALTAMISAKSAQVDRFQVAGITTPAALPGANPRTFLNRTMFDEAVPTLGRFAVSQRAIPQNTQNEAAVFGVVSCKLNVPANGEFIDRADIDPADNTRLLSQLNGSAQILWQDTGTGVVDAIVRLGNAEYTHATGKVITTDIAAGAIDGLIRVWDNGVDTGYNIPDVRHTWMTGDLPVSVGKEVIVTWFPYEGIWRITHAECEDPQTTIGQLSDDATSPTQAVTNGVSSPVGAFAASQDLNTPNVTMNAAAAEITIPDPGTASLYDIRVSGTVEVANNNVGLEFESWIDGAFDSRLTEVTIQNASTSQTLSVSGYRSIAGGQSHAAALRIKPNASTTVTYTQMTYSVKRVFE